MRGLTASIRTAAAEATLQFDWLLGDANFFSFKRAEALTGLSDSFLEKLWDGEHNGLHISGHEYGAGKKNVRMTKRISRAFMVALLVKSAKYSSETKLNVYLSCLREFSAEELLWISNEAQRAVAAKTPRLPAAQSGTR